jgi:hypothetical protein
MGLKSPSDGRWDGRGRTGFVTSPCTEKKKDALIRTFWQRPGLWGSALGRWDMDLDGQDATSASWTTSRACGSVLGFLGTCDRLLEPQEGQRFAHWMVIMP